MKNISSLFAGENYKRKFSLVILDVNDDRIKKLKIKKSCQQFINDFKIK
jgi:hypothetical protein